MSNIVVYWPAKISLPNKREIMDFLDAMMKRLAVGYTRYGAPSAQKSYMSRMETELKSYKRSGNMEHLLNMANYAILESLAPQHPKHHWDPHIDSVTRRRTLT